MDTCFTDYALPANVPPRVLTRLIDRLKKLSRDVQANPRYGGLDANFGSVMLEYTLRDLAERPYPFQCERDYEREALRRFWKIARRNAWSKAVAKTRSKETLLDEEGWSREENRCHLPGSVMARRQNEYDPARRLQEEELPSHSELITALQEIGMSNVQAVAWILLRWEETDNYHELCRSLSELTGKTVKEATIAKWNERHYRDRKKMCRLYTLITGEQPNDELIERLLNQTRYSPGRHSPPRQEKEAATSTRARQEDTPAGAKFWRPPQCIRIYGGRRFIHQAERRIAHGYRATKPRQLLWN